MWTRIGKLVFDILVAAGAVACVLVWLEVKPKDVRMMTWPHWLWLIGALILFAISSGSSLRSLYLNMVADRRFSAKIASINQANTEQIARINKQHESDEYRIRQARDEIAAELQTMKGKYLAENIEKTNFQKELARAEDRATELQARFLALAPRVVGVRFGIQRSDNRCGLWVINDGEAAYDITLPDVVQVGASKLTFHTKSIPRLTKSDGEVLCESWIERESHSNLLGNGLFDEMVSQRIDAIELPIRYKDGDNRYYITRCRLERDVSANGGIATRYIRQEVEDSATASQAQMAMSKPDPSWVRFLTAYPEIAGPPEPGKEPAKKPQKLRAEFLNCTEFSYKVKVISWECGSRGLDADFWRKCLQLRIGGDWYPHWWNAVEELHVAPGESFKLWVFPKATFSDEQFRARVSAGNLGIVHLLIDGKEVSVSIG